MRNLNVNDTVDLSVEEIKDSIHILRGRLRTASVALSWLSSTYSQDIHVAEANRDKVMTWSVIHLVASICILIIQVVMVKNLFADKSFLYKMIQAVSPS